MQQHFTCLLVLFFFLSYHASAQPSKFIHVDQFGYLTDADKVAVLSNPQTGYNSTDIYTPGAIIELRNFLTDAIEYSAAPTTWDSGNTHAQSGDQGWWFDFFISHC